MTDVEQKTNDNKKIKIQNLPLGITEERIKAHKISPEHIKPARKADELAPYPAAVSKLKKPAHLDIEAFSEGTRFLLEGGVAGYMLQITKYGQVIWSYANGWAQTPADKGEGWTQDTQMHIASVSKFLTAVGMVKCLNNHDPPIPTNAKIIDYLPDYWPRGVNIEDIEFQHLLTHKSGFSSAGGSTGASNYLYMKNMVAGGASNIGTYDYENMNFALCRILIPIINGDIDKTRNFADYDPDINDNVWDMLTIMYYKVFMNVNVFYPAGVYYADFKPGPFNPCALAYPHQYYFSDESDYPEKGCDSGDLKSISGGAGWRLSTRELLKVMDHFRRRNTIVDKNLAKQMLDSYFGVDVVEDTPAGRIYYKNGYHPCKNTNTGDENDTKKKWAEQSVAFFLPNHMELVVFVNSPLFSSDHHLASLIRERFLHFLVES
jgi:CubicO group peptidase (beta-lactamase class C family)